MHSTLFLFNDHFPLSSSYWSLPVISHCGRFSPPGLLLYCIWLLFSYNVLYILHVCVIMLCLSYFLFLISFSMLLSISILLPSNIIISSPLNNGCIALHSRYTITSYQFVCSWVLGVFPYFVNSSYYK